jgi:hypothetical protein
MSKRQTGATDYDAVVVGSGPNGLAAAITLQQKGLRVLLVEAKQTIGGGMRSAELTLPGFTHDICSAVHPLAAGSPFFTTLPLHEHGLEFIYPPVAAAHPFDDGTAAILAGTVEDTALALGKDADAYRRLLQPIVSDWPVLAPELLGPLRWPGDVSSLVRFGWVGLSAATHLARRFQTREARGLLAGMAAHSIQPLTNLATSAIALSPDDCRACEGLAGAPAWIGGDRRCAGLLFYLAGRHDRDRCRGEKFFAAAFFALRAAGPDAQAIAAIGRASLVFAVPMATGAIPLWDGRLQDRLGVGRAYPLHCGGLSPGGHHPYRQYAGRDHRLGSCDGCRRVSGPAFCIADATERFRSFTGAAGAAYGVGLLPCAEWVDERYDGSDRKTGGTLRARFPGADPGRHVFDTAQLEEYNANYIGGDINGGIIDIRQLFTRPALRWSPYRTSEKGIYICSSSTPPGGGVHGMCGYHAARSGVEGCVWDG